MINYRTAGILLHITSLPGKFGIGDLGSDAYKFVDFLESAGQKLWQILPIGPTGYGDSPYSCFSAFAGNHLFISLELLIEEGLLDQEDILNLPNFNPSKVEFGKVQEYKLILLRKSFKNFNNSENNLKTNFENFCYEKQEWLDDFALFK